MENFDIHYAANDRQFDLHILAKKNSIKGVYYSVYDHGVWLANICKKGRNKYKALSYTGAFPQNDLDIIGHQIDLIH